MEKTLYRKKTASEIQIMMVKKTKKFLGSLGGDLNRKEKSTDSERLMTLCEMGWSVET